MDRSPVTAPYNILCLEDHFTKLTGDPVWKFYEIMLNPESAAKYYRAYAEHSPFDVFETFRWQRNKDTHEFRENTEAVVNDSGIYFHNKRTDEYEKLPEQPYDFDDAPVETQSVFDEADAKTKIPVVSADALLSSGFAMHTEECVKLFGDSRFIQSGRILNTFYQSSWYLGLTNLYYMLADEDPLLEYVQKRILEANIEKIRAYAACGGDAILIDDAMSTNDMISAADYERYSLPYMQQEIQEIHRLGKKAIVVYFGGIADRVEQIVATGADALIMECSMKNYRNDYAEIAAQVNDRLCVYTNMNPVSHVLDLDSAALAQTISDYSSAAKQHKKYVISTGSPLTPDTPWERILEYAELAKR